MPFHDREYDVSFLRILLYAPVGTLSGHLLPRHNSPFQTARPATDSPMSWSQSVEEEDNGKDRETYDDPEPAHDRSPSLH